MNTHFTLSVIANLDALRSPGMNRVPCVVFMDSLTKTKSHNPEHITRVLCDFLLAQWNFRTKEDDPALDELARSLFKRGLPILKVSVPLQDNYIDCGFYCARFAEEFLRVNPIITEVNITSQAIPGLGESMFNDRSIQVK